MGPGAAPRRPVSSLAGGGSSAARGLLLVVLCLVVYNSNLRATGAYDSLAASLIPFEVWHGHGVRLDRAGSAFPPDISYSFVPSRAGGWVSLYPIVTPLLVTPLYAPTLFVPWFRADDPTHGSLVRVAMEKLSASLLTALSALFVYLAARRRVAERTALGLTAVYAFATPSWAISSQALWLHGAGQLLLAAALYLLLDREEIGAWRAAGLGLLAGLLVANRPQDVVFAVAIAWLVVRRAGWRAWPFAAAGVAVGLPLVLYNLHHFATVLGGYAGYRLPDGTALRPSFPDPAAIAGLLFSNRGLFTFCPFLLLALAAVRRPGRGREELLALGSAFAASVLFYAAFPAWWAGYTYGPRYLSDALPALALLLAAPLARLRPRGRALFAAAALYGVVLQAIGAYFYPSGDSGYPSHGFWTVARSSPVLAASSGPATPHFLEPFAPALSMDAPIPPGAVAALAWSEPPPRAWCVEGGADLAFSVENRSPLAWSSFGQVWGIHAVRLLATWYREGEDEAFRSADYWLAAHLPPGGRKELTIPVGSPKSPGRYRLVVGPAQFDTGVRLVPLAEHRAPALVVQANVAPRRSGRCR